MADELSFDYVVVGGGVMGAMSAAFLAQKVPSGKRICLLEQFDALHSRGSSHGDSRIIRRTYPSRFYTQLMLLAYEQWRLLEKEADAPLLHVTSGLDLCREDHPTKKNVLEAARACGVPTSIRSADAVWRSAAVRLPPGYVAIAQADTGVLNATRCVAAALQLARSRGVKVLEGCRVDSVAVDESGRVRLDCSRRSGGGPTERRTTIAVTASTRVAICPGAWARSALLRWFGVDLPLTVWRTQVTYFATSPEGRPGHADMPVLIDYGSHYEAKGETVDRPAVYVLPSREFPGMVKVASHHGPDCDPRHRDFAQNDTDLRDTVIPWVRRVLPWLRPRPVMTQTCMYTMTPDEDFVVDMLSSAKHGLAAAKPFPGAAGAGGAAGGRGEPTRRVPVRHWDKFVIACGFSGHGFKLSPVVGQCVAELMVEGRVRCADVRPWSVARFKPAAADEAVSSYPAETPLGPDLPLDDEKTMLHAAAML